MKSHDDAMKKQKGQYCTFYRVSKGLDVFNNYVGRYVKDRGWLIRRYRTEYEVSTNRNRPTTTNEDPQTHVGTQKDSWYVTRGRLACMILELLLLVLQP